MSEIVILSTPGQLGNNLILFAHVIAFCLSHDLRAISFGFLPHAEHFAGTRGALLVCAYPPRRERGEQLGMPRLVRSMFRRSSWAASKAGSYLMAAKGDRFFDLGLDHSRIPANLDRLQELSATYGTVFLRGWSFRDPMAVSMHGASLREYFRPVEPYARSAAARAEEARGDGLLIGVHVRRGDYLQYRGGAFCYSDGTYVTLIRQTRQLFPPGANVSFIITSDDPMAGERIAAMCPELSIGQGTGHVIEDLSLLGECDYLLGPPSTFSKWASFYGRKPLYQVRGPSVPFTLSDFVVFSGLEP